MTKTITAVLGILLLVLGVSSLVLIRQDQMAAEAVDQSFTQSEGLENSNCQRVIQQASLSKRVMTEKESQTLRIVLANNTSGAVCNTTVSLAALNFELAPPATDRVVALEPGGDPVVLLWILKPRETGSFEIAVSAGDQTEILGIVVTNVLGFTAVQIQILSYISSFLGPMLTAPWWYEQWEKRKKARKEEAEKAEKAAEQAKAKQGAGAEGDGRTFIPE